MPLFGDLTYAKPTNFYAGAPVDEVKALNKEASAQYNQARDAKDLLDVTLNNIPVEERANHVKQKVIDDVRNQFKELVASGNYQDAGLLVNKVSKDVAMNNEYQEAIKSQAAKTAYQANLKAKLDKGLAGEKGGITEEQYKYALTKSELANSTPFQYDPKTMRANNFQGVNISDDLSQEIADQTFDRIKDWKANGIVFADGKTFKIDRATGVERIMKDGHEVTYQDVANALKQDVLNNDAFKRYLDESRDIDKFNKTFNYETKTQRPLDRHEDLGMLTDAELKEMYLGATDKQMQDLAKSKSLEDKATLLELQNKEKTFNLNDPKVIESIHDDLARKEQLNKVVYPAAEKASFKDFEQKIFTDSAALEAVKLRNAKKLKDYEQAIQTPIMKSTSQANLFTGDDFSKKQDNIKALQSKAQEALALMNKTNKNSSLYRTRVDDYNNALSQLNIANSEVKNFYSALTPEAKQKIAPKIANMFGNNEDQTNRDNKISDRGLMELVNQAHLDGDKATQAELLTARMYLKNGNTLPPEFLQNLTNKLINNENYLKIISDEDDKISQRTAWTNNNESGFTNLDSEQGILSGVVEGINSGLKTMANAVIPFYGSRTTINNIVTDEFNSKALDQSLELMSIPSMEGIEDKKYIPALTKQFYGAAQNILTNSSDLTTNDGTPLDAILSGQSDKKFYKLDEKGKYVQTLPDMDKTQSALATGAKDGIKRLSNTYYDKEGKPLILSEGTPSGSNAGRTAVIISSKNPDTFTPLYDIMSEYAAQSGNQNDALSLQGEKNFGGILNKARLGNNVDPFEITFPNGNSRVIEFKKEADDASTIIDKTPTINGLPNANYNKPIFGQNHSTFRSNKELMKAFQMSMQ